MDQINYQFQQLLQQKQFHLKQIEEEEAWVYRGKIAMNPKHVVDFAIMIRKSEGRAIGQIVFQNIDYCTNFSEREKWLTFINQWNLSHSVYYYMCMEQDGGIFIRHITEIMTDIESFYNIIIAGSAVARQAIEQLQAFKNT